VFHKILVCLDASERASGVFDLATQVARSCGARLYVLRVLTIPPEFPPAAAGSVADALVPQMAMTAMQDLSRLVAGAPDDLSIQPPIVRVGVPWKAILETAEERDVDLIVLGSHGYQGWDRVIGTTAGKVANIANRNVLIVHERKRDPETREDGGSKAAEGATSRPTRSDPTSSETLRPRKASR
jgi:universal stress protein F